MVEGIIIKGIGGFYYVKVNNSVLECRARGIFRKKNIKPLVGDKVKVEIIDEKKTGYIYEICSRKNELFRPPVSNVDHVVIVFSISNPNPNLWLIDRFLLLAEYQNIEITICINKIDLYKDKKSEQISNIYRKIGYRVIKTSCIQKKGIEDLKAVLKGKISVIAGPSGVGKSSLLNCIQANLKLKTGEISKKTNRGKHTTRSTELLELNNGGWVVDTPGFSSLNIDFITNDELDKYFIDIKKYKEQCKFANCKHINEPKCGVKEACKKGNIDENRYNNYVNFFNEIIQKRRY